MIQLKYQILWVTVYFPIHVLHANDAISAKSVGCSYSNDLKPDPNPLFRLGLRQIDNWGVN